MDVTSVVLGLAVVLLVTWLWKQRKPASLPPGPPCLPIFGNVLSMTDEPLHVQFNAWRKVYGDVFTFSIGNQHDIALNGYKAIKEALVTNSVQFAGRPPAENVVRLKYYSPNYPTTGIADMTHSEEWKKQRNNALQILRTFGYGKHSTERKICDEASYLRDYFLERAGKPIDPAASLNVSVSNVICSLLYGERYEHDDKEFNELVQTIALMFKLFQEEPAGDRIWLMSLKPRYSQVLKELEVTMKKLNDFNGAKIQERQERLEREGYDEPRDFIEGYLKELHESEQGKSRLGENWIYGILNDFFLAGSETTATTMSWALLWMAHKPDVQKKVQMELDKVLGREPCDVNADLRSKCPYVDATLMEIQRISAIAPISLMHATTEDVNFRGYALPKNTEVFVNIYSVLMDPEAWPEPETFSSERFLDADGAVKRPEQWIPFSMGRRVCIGEQLARQELFIFFSTMMHSFHVRMPDGVAANFEPVDMGVLKPEPYEIIFEPRLD